MIELSPKSTRLFGIKLFLLFTHAQVVKKDHEINVLPETINEIQIANRTALAVPNTNSREKCIRW